MVLGTIKFNEDSTNIRLLNFYLIRDCKYYVNYYCSKKNKKEDLIRLQKIQDEIKATYKLDWNIKQIIIEILNYIYINPNHNLELQVGYIKGAPVEKLYKLINFGNLSIRGSDIFERAFKYALIRKNWRI